MLIFKMCGLPVNFVNKVKGEQIEQTDIYICSQQYVSAYVSLQNEFGYF